MRIIFFIIICFGCIRSNKTDNYEIEGKVNAFWGKKIILRFGSLSRK